MSKTVSATRSSHLPAKAPSEADHLGLERLVFFSDGIFAIAVTLLALEIRLPNTDTALNDAELLYHLGAIGSRYLGYVLSFLVIGLFWIGHHRRYRFIERANSGLLFLNLLQLMVVAFMPFPTSIISEYGNRTATIFYASTVSVMGLISSAIWWYATSHQRLISANLDAHVIRREFLRSAIIPAIFLLSIGLAFIDNNLAKLSWVLLGPAWLVIR